MTLEGGTVMKKGDPYTKEADTRFTLRIPTELLDAIKKEADENKRSAGKQIEFILENWVRENAVE
jgi:hypothetical protein